MRLIFIYWWPEERSYSRAILARAPGEGSAYQRAPAVGVHFLLLLFQRLPRFQAAACIEIGTAEPAGTVARRDGTAVEEAGNRSNGGSDAGASTEPRQGAGALRCLSIAPSSFWQHYVSVTSSPRLAFLSPPLTLRSD